MTEREVPGELRFEGQEVCVVLTGGVGWGAAETDNLEYPQRLHLGFNRITVCGHILMKRTLNPAPKNTWLGQMCYQNSAPGGHACLVHSSEHENGPGAASTQGSAADTPGNGQSQEVRPWHEVHPSDSHRATVPPGETCLETFLVTVTAGGRK